jgi:hypothetical protein
LKYFESGKSPSVDEMQPVIEAGGNTLRSETPVLFIVLRKDLPKQWKCMFLKYDKTDYGCIIV